MDNQCTGQPYSGKYSNKKLRSSQPPLSHQEREERGIDLQRAHHHHGRLRLPPDKVGGGGDHDADDQDA